MKKPADKNIEAHKMAMRRAERAERLEALAEGRKLRAHTFADRKAVADKEACRDKGNWDA